MCAYSKSWDETAPIDHTQYSAQPGNVRDLKTAVRERLQNSGMYFPSTHDEDAGEFTNVKCNEESSNPSATTGKWKLYFKSDGMYIIDPSGTVSQISAQPFKSGDWIISSVTTARTGWTNVSATYSDKFMRINSTPLTTGGADSHTHTGPSHTHTGPSHQHASPWGHDGALSVFGASTAPFGTSGTMSGTHAHGLDGNTKTVNTPLTSAAGTGATGASGTGNTGSANNIPVFISVCIFQKD